ncbi:MAG: VCBS repeat-containing protein [Myxococcota bacterium]
MRRTPLLFVGLLAACGGPTVNVDLVFPDDQSKADTNGFVLTAVEPFIPGPQDSGRERVLLKCGELSVFGPYAKVNRDVSDLPNLQVLMNREPQTFPFASTWNLSLEKFKSSEETNPWRAVMVHFEARGQARKSDGGLAASDEAKTLLEGCYCMRLNADATSSDQMLDAEVKQNCPSVTEMGGERRRVELTAVARNEFRLAPCGVTQLTGAKNRKTTLNPGVCVKASICGAGGTASGCYSCSTQKCPELDDLKNVPIRVTVQQDNGASKADPHIILSNKGGRVAPEVELDDCRTPITVRAEIVGRPDQRVDFPITCVDPIDFNADPDAQQPIGSAAAPSVVSISTIPKVVDAGGAVVTQARVAVLLSVSGSARLEVFEARTGQPGITRAASMTFTDEHPFAVLGYHYRVGPNREDRQLPLLAVVNGRPNKPGRPIVRIFKVAETGAESDRLKLVSSSTVGDGPHVQGDVFCPYSACSGTGDCQTPPCALELDLTAVSGVSIAAADINGDGLSELAFGTDRLFHLTTFYTRPSEQNGPPLQLMDRCACSSLGRGLPSFDLVQLGGVGSATQNRVDLLMGDGTGAYVRYAVDNTFDGEACDPTDPNACGADFECFASCAAGMACPQGVCAGNGVCLSGSCYEPCGGPTCGGGQHCNANNVCVGQTNSGRCLKTCRPGQEATDCAGFPMGTSCMQASPDHSYCAAPNIGCKSPSAVWPLITIHDVTKGHIAGTQFDDAIAVGAGSPVPGFTGTGFVRIMFGGNLDLSKLGSLPEDQRNAASVDLIPRRLINPATGATEDAQGPRSAEVGDFNADGIDDVAVLYTGTEEVRVWLGSQRQAPGEIGEKPSAMIGSSGRIRLTNCQGNCSPSQKCFPFNRFAVADLDGDGRSEVLAVCVPENGTTAAPTLKWYAPRAE